MKSTRIEARYSPGKGFSLQASSDEPAPGLVYQLGFWSAVTLAVLGGVYLALMAGMGLTGSFVMPPPAIVQLIAGVLTLLCVPALIVLAGAIRAQAPADRAVLGQIGLVFAGLAALSFGINRFVQLSVVQQSVASGATEGLARFMPYADGSVMLTLELMGWGFWLGQAALCFAPLFGGDRLGQWLRGLWIAYGVLALASSLGVILAVPALSLLGFVAWGPVLTAISVLLAVYFKRAGREPVG